MFLSSCYWIFPSEWKKKRNDERNDKRSIKNYCLVCLISVAVKLLENLFST